MDRLENLGVKPYSAPGLLPGILGVFIAVLGVWRSLCVRCARSPDRAGDDERHRVAPRCVLPIALCLGFAAGLVGRGLPFWLAAVDLRHRDDLHAAVPERWRGQALRGSRRATVASAPASAITLVFQELFLVRLP